MFSIPHPQGMLLVQKVVGMLFPPHYTPDFSIVTDVCVFLNRML